MNRLTQTGFTLIEMSIVLVIIALLIGGALAPLSAQKEQEWRKENQQLLQEAKEALLGYAIVNGYLPCPDTNNDGREDTAGGPGACGPTTANPAQFYPSGVQGRLPWVTLGLNAKFDPWGENHFVYYAVTGAFASNTLSITSASLPPGQLDIYDTAAGCNSLLSPVALDVSAVIWTSAKNLYFMAPTLSAEEIENTDFDNCFVSREYNTIAGQEFDDQVVWLSPNVLFNRMITAGTL